LDTPSAIPDTKVAENHSRADLGAGANVAVPPPAQAPGAGRAYVIAAIAVAGIVIPT
jgi:hypothetical protein